MSPTKSMLGHCSSRKSQITATRTGLWTERLCPAFSEAPAKAASLVIGIYRQDNRERKTKPILHGCRQLLEEAFGKIRETAICHMAWPMAIFGNTLSSSVSRLVFWAHDAASGKHWLEKWARRVSPNLVIGNSLFTKTTLPALFPSAPCSVLYCPVILPQSLDAKQCRSAVRRELGVSDDAVAIIQISRMEALKGHHLHLQALSKIKDDPRWICWMVGGAQRPAEQEYLCALQGTAIKLGIGDRVRFLGQRSDVQRLLAAADIFSQPNVGIESFGIVFIEALWAGLPVVATAMGGPREIINDSCGMLVPPDNPDRLAASLQLLIDSPELRARLGQRGPERALELCDPGKRIPDLYELLQGAARN